VPLSKARMKERKRRSRVKPEWSQTSGYGKVSLELVKPNNEALQSNSSGIKPLLNSTVSLLVQSNIADEVIP